jgi:hypothetical protein
MQEIHERESRLVEAHIYQHKIDEATFQRQTQRLREEMDLVRNQLSDATPKVDLDATLDFANRMLGDPAGFWKRAPAAQRPRVQRAIYPNGLRYDQQLIGTADISLAFNYLASIQVASKGVASPTGAVRRASVEQLAP